MLEGSNVMVQNGLFRYTPRPLNFIVGEVWAFAYYFSVVSIVIQFWYRYLYVCRDTILSTINHALLLIAGAGIVLFYDFLIYLVIYPPPMEKLPGTMGVKLHEFFDYGDPENHYTQVAMLARPAILPLSAVLIGFFCGLVCGTAAAVDKMLSFYITAYLTAFVPFIPVLNPLITLIIVKPYRNHIWRILTVRQLLSSPSASKINPASNTATTRPKARGSMQSTILTSEGNKE
ncbi:hypothetical protein Ddc_19428 [Ditylenchus destructor]|nr:hypothetical protein Ddc_19428 [Ditylenchus destructor]